MEDKKHFIEIQNRNIFYKLVRTKRKTIGITIDMSGEVKISAPLRMSEKQIVEVVEKKANWIIKKLSEIQAVNKNVVIKQFVDGEKLLYLGKEYELKVIEQNSNKVEVILQEDKISVYLPQHLQEENKKQLIKEALFKWYRKCFSKIVDERIMKYSLQIQVTPCKVVIKDQKTRWGSCSTRGNINLNWRLVMAPISIIDYVIVHELCHMKVMNHSKEFWRQVEFIMPDYKERREWLKENGYMLKL